jgi:hypothetical protein
MNSDFWLYTLSAIPQTLGALVALTATFVIFKLDHVEERTKREYEEIKDWVLTILFELKVHDITKFDDYALLEKLNESIEKLDPDKDRFGLEDTRFNQLYSMYEHVLISHKRKIDNYKNIYEYLLEKKRVLSSLIDVRRNALTRLRISLLLTSAPIVLSLIALPAFPLLAECGPMIVSALALFSIVAVVYTVLSVWDIARRNLR